MGEDQYYSLDEFAQMMAMTPRNVRAYATRGLIDRPIRAGRRAVYTTAHRVQLEWVLEQFAKERLPLHVIRRQIERGQRPPLDDVIGGVSIGGVSIGAGSIGGGSIGGDGIGTVDAEGQGASRPAVMPEFGQAAPRPHVAPAATQSGTGAIPAVRRNTDDALALAPFPDATYLEPGDPLMPVSVWVDLPDYEPRVFRLMAAVERLPQALGYVHFRDTHLQINPVWRVSAWHRSLPSGEARTRAEAAMAYLRGEQAARAVAPSSAAARAVEDIVDLATELDDVAVWVGPVVVVGLSTRGGEALVVAREVSRGLLELLAEAPREATRPRRLLDHLATGPSERTPSVGVEPAG